MLLPLQLSQGCLYLYSCPHPYSLCPKAGSSVGESVPPPRGLTVGISSHLPMAGGQSSQVTPLEQEADAQWLIPMRLQEGRTQAGKGGTPKPPASTWACPFGPEMRDRAWKEGVDFEGHRGWGQGTERNSLLCMAEVIAEV